MVFLLKLFLHVFFCCFRELEIIIADKNRQVQEFDTNYDGERRDFTNENNNFMAQNRTLKQLLAKKQRIETDIVNTEKEIVKNA